MLGSEIISYALVLSSEFFLGSSKTLNTSLMCLGYLIVFHSPPCRLASLVSLYRFLCLCIYFVEFSDKMKAVVPFPCSCIGHMLNVLSPVGSGRSWLEKIHLDFCRVQVKQLVVRDSYTMLQI